MYPWIGAGSLPFRGGVNPENVDATINTYRGMSTVTIQSAFRYDYPLEMVKEAIAKLNTELPKNRLNFEPVSASEREALNLFNEKSAEYWRETIEAIAPIINAVADNLPNHRERVQHVGLFGYSRGIGKVKLPRAIKFTGALYSLGIPPELIASGRAFKLAKEMGILDVIHRLCPHLAEDFIHAGHYLNRENLELAIKLFPELKAVMGDIQEIEDTLKIQIGPDKTHHIIHRNFTSNIFHRLQLNEDFSEDVLKAAEIRKSLG
jgi:phosphoenolpyruvate carboxylase